MKRITGLGSIAAALALTGCATGIMLTDRGTRVEQVGMADVPDGCQMLGDVSIGIPPDAARPRTEEQLTILMRNKAGEFGATHVLVESSEQRPGQAGEVYWVGRGRGYRCPEQRAVQAPPPEEGGGEEEVPEEEEEEAPPRDE